eukprot:TRINITY_DN10937_c0_g2_i1.p1 TRINITY_DN10937_c0_g2~~TRINITY_DN10937_c0_g2_i1.p1  ORF type:complete len:1144 (+),score=214.64 TRINITY_DN10937_c0_g2_i1:93-3434(+)
MAAVTAAQMATDMETARVVQIVQVVFDAFHYSCSPCTSERQRAEAAIQSAERMPGFLVALLRIAMESSADPAIRQAAAIQLKNQVKRWWQPVDENTDVGYGEQEKAMVRDQLFGAISGVVNSPKVRDQLVECLRFVARADFPDRWMGLVGSVLTGLESDDIPRTYGALLVLRRLYKHLELRPVARRGDMEALCAATLPALGNLAPSLAEVASEEALVMLKLVLKCVYSSLHMAVSDTMRQGLDMWMRLVLAVAALPIPLSQLPADMVLREACPFAKVKKWAFQILFRFFHRHGDRRRAVDGRESLAEYWLASFGPAATQVCIHEACSLSTSGWAPRRSAALALLCLGRACSKDTTFGVMSPVLHQLLVEGIFPWVRFGESDLALWREDQEELVRQLSGDVDTFQEPRVAALELVEKLVVHRREDVLLPLLQFCQNHLEVHAAASSAGTDQPASLIQCANKDGALRVLGCIGDELVNLDASQKRQGRKKKLGRARTADGGGSTCLNLEELVARHVQPDLGSPMAFLRLRACWFYQRVVEKMHFRSAEAPLAACSECLRLADDAELPVRVQACICLQAFLQRDSADGINQLIVQNLAQVLERLLRTLAEVSCDEVSETLETLATQFPEEMAPFACRLVEQLAAQFSEALAEQEGEGEEDADASPISSAQTIVTILQSCSVLRDPRDTIERGRRQDLFTHLARSLMPLLSRLLRFDGSGREVLEEALELLNHLTLFGSSPFPAELWEVVPMLYESVCGRMSGALVHASDESLSSAASASTCEPPKFVEGWALDALPEILEPFANFIARGPAEEFIARTWGGLSYPQMVFSMMRKVLGLRGEGHERDGIAGALLAVVLFENAPAGSLDQWIPSYFDTTWSRWPSVTSAALRSALLTLLAVLVWYNAELVIRCAEERQCAQHLVEAWVKNACVVKSLPRRKIMVLGLARLLRLGFHGSLPSSITASLADVTRQLAEQSPQVARLRIVYETLAAESCNASPADDWSFSDATGPPSGASIRMPRFGESCQHMVEADEEEVEEGEVLSVPCGGEVDRRPSRLDKVDELALLLEVLRWAPDLARRQVDLWLGEGELVRWEADLDAECLKRAAPIGQAAAVAG